MPTEREERPVSPYLGTFLPKLSFPSVKTFFLAEGTSREVRIAHRTGAEIKAALHQALGVGS